MDAILLLLAYLPELILNDLPSKAMILVQIFTQYSVKQREFALIPSGYSQAS